MTTEVRADVARHAVHSRREIRTLSIEAMVERIDRCVRTRSPVDVTTPAATIIAVRARSMSEAEVMSASCARFNESRRECNARCSGECRSVSTPPPREPRRALYIHQIKIIRQASKTHDSRGSLNRRCAPRYREVEFRLGNHGSGPKCVRARILRSELFKNSRERSRDGLFFDERDEGRRRANSIRRVRHRILHRRVVAV